MGIDSVSNEPAIDGAADRGDRAEQTAGQQSSAGDHRPAETLSREEYSDQVRARGSPIGQHDKPPRDTTESGQTRAPEGTSQVPESDRLNGRPPEGDINTSDFAGGPDDNGGAPRTPEPARAETNGAADQTGQAGQPESGPAERPTESPARPAEGGDTMRGADPALSADARAAANAQAASMEQEAGKKPGETGEGDSASGHTGTPPDNPRAESRWEDSWSLPDGRQVHVHLDGDRDWMHSGETGTEGDPPAGEELLTMEDDDASRSEKLRSKFFEQENCESFLDAEKEGAKIVQDVLSPPQHTSAHTLTPMVEITPTPPPQADAGGALTGITVFALLSAEAVRSAVKHWRALERT